MKSLHLVAALGVITLAAASVACAHQSEETIPEAFRGEWNEEIDRCADLESGTRVVVRARSIVYFEEGDEVHSVTRLGPDTIRISATFETYDGSEPLTRTLTLSEAGEILTLTNSDGASSVNERCPQGDPDVE